MAPFFDFFGALVDLGDFGDLVDFTEGDLLDLGSFELSVGDFVLLCRFLLGNIGLLVDLGALLL